MWPFQDCRALARVLPSYTNQLKPWDSIYKDTRGQILSQDLGENSIFQTATPSWKIFHNKVPFLLLEGTRQGVALLYQPIKTVALH